MESECLYMGINNTGYAGGFGANVVNVIKSLIESPCLHLFSGTSKIGDIRVDIERPEATINCDVFDFIKDNKQHWKWCVLDPPYKIENAHSDLKQYGDWTCVTASVPKRRALEEFFIKYCDNVLWLDLASPKPQGFVRKKVWTFIPSSYQHIRALTWLKRSADKLEDYYDNQA